MTRTKEPNHSAEHVNKGFKKPQFFPISEVLYSIKCHNIFSIIWYRIDATDVHGDSCLHFLRDRIFSNINLLIWGQWYKTVVGQLHWFSIYYFTILIRCKLYHSMMSSYKHNKVNYKPDKIDEGAGRFWLVIPHSLPCVHPRYQINN